MKAKVKKRLQKDIDYSKEMQAYWNKYRQDFLVLLSITIVVLFVYFFVLK